MVSTQVGELARRLGIGTARNSGLIADGVLFLTNVVYLTPAAGWLESLVQRTFGGDDAAAARQLAILLSAVVVLQVAGAYLKRRPMQSRLAKQSTDMGGFGTVLLFGNYILGLLILITVVVLFRWSGDSPVPFFVVAVLAAVPTYLTHRALQPLKRSDPNSTLAAPAVEWIADACLLAYVIANTMFFNLLTGFRASPPASVGDVVNHLLSLFVVLAIVMLWYLPPRQLFLAEDFRDRGIWIRMLVAMAPIAWRWVV